MCGKNIKYKVCSKTSLNLFCESKLKINCQCDFRGLKKGVKIFDDVDDVYCYRTRVIQYIMEMGMCISLEIELFYFRPHMSRPFAFGLVERMYIVNI